MGRVGGVEEDQSVVLGELRQKLLPRTVHIFCVHQINLFCHVGITPSFCATRFTPIIHRLWKKERENAEKFMKSGKPTVLDIGFIMIV
jgi:hypothetical protein